MVAAIPRTHRFRTSRPFASGRFEEIDGELTLTVATSGRQSISLPAEINPDEEQPGGGPARIKEKKSVETLRRNGLLGQAATTGRRASRSARRAASSSEKSTRKRRPRPRLERPS